MTKDLHVNDRTNSSIKKKKHYNNVYITGDN